MSGHNFLALKLYVSTFLGLHVPLAGLTMHVVIVGRDGAGTVLLIAFLSTLVGLGGTWAAIHLLLRTERRNEPSRTTKALSAQ